MSDDNKPKMGLAASQNKVSKLKRGYDAEVRSILEHLLKRLEDGNLANVMAAFTTTDGMSYVLISPMTGATAAYLSKQIDMEFMAQYMFPDEGI